MVMVKVKLLRQARITHHEGEIVEVSPSEAHFLCSVQSAVMVEEVSAASPVKKAKKPAKAAAKKE